MPTSRREDGWQQNTSGPRRNVAAVLGSNLWFCNARWQPDIVKGAYSTPTIRARAIVMNGWCVVGALASVQNRTDLRGGGAASFILQDVIASFVVTFKSG